MMTLGVFGSARLLVMSCKTVPAMFHVFKARWQVRYSTTMPLCHQMVFKVWNGLEPLPPWSWKCSRCLSTKMGWRFHYTNDLCYQMVFSSAMLWNLQHYSLVVCDRMLVTACKTIPAMFQMFNQDGGQWFHHNAICHFKWYLNCGMCQTLCHMFWKYHTPLCALGVFQVSKQNSGLKILLQCYSNSGMGWNLHYYM